MKRLLSILGLVSVAFASSPLVNHTPVQADSLSPASWNEMKKENTDGTATSEFHVKWVNYMAPDDSWEKIDPTVTQTATGFVMTNAPFTFNAPLLADGESYFNSNNRWDIFDKKAITAAPIGMWMKALDASPVAGVPFDLDGNGVKSAVLYTNAFPQWNADLIYHVTQKGLAPNLEKLIRFNSNPGNVNPRFFIHFTEDPSTSVIDVQQNLNVWDKAKVTTKEGLSFKKKNTFERRGIGMKPFKIWDSTKGFDKQGNPLQKIQKIDVDYETATGGYILTKHVLSSFFTKATLPVFTDTTTTFFPDPHTETTSMDGIAYKDNGPGSYSALRTGNGTVGRTANASDAPSYLESDVTSNNWHFMTRGFFLFDTSSIGSSNAVSAATFSLVVSSKTTTMTDSHGLVASTPASNTTLVASDFEGTVNNLTRFATDIAGSAITADNATYNNWSMNAAGIAAVSLTGITKLGTKNASDIDNSPPTWGNDIIASIQVDMAETAGTSKDPKLVVTYAAAPTAAPHLIIDNY